MRVALLRCFAAVSGPEEVDEDRQFEVAEVLPVAQNPNVVAG